ncbi:MAG TPA: hypothetical protein VHP32_05855 [Ignavibacteria bacterium]|nr:hypothetical protein [Ignavibacteria bacterium]
MRKMLFHFSEKPDIKKFFPQIISYNNLPACVWAIDEEHSVNYFFPRDCPRIIYAKSENITAKDEEKFFGGTNANKIITVENKNQERLSEAVIYKYTFDKAGFKLQDKIAGYYISYNEIIPLKCERMENLINKIKNTGAELRFMDDLNSLRIEILNSSIDNYSIIKMEK